MRMAGVPEASFEFWASKFIDIGYRVAKVDQAETAVSKKSRESLPGATKVLLQLFFKSKIINRELVCIITSGTLTEPSMLKNYVDLIYIAIIYDSGANFKLAFYEASLNHFLIQSNSSFTINEIIKLINLKSPKEIILNTGNPLIEKRIKNSLTYSKFYVNKFSSSNHADEKLDESSKLLVGILDSFLHSLKQECLLESLEIIDEPFISNRDSLSLDYEVLVDLNVISTGAKTHQSSLFDQINTCSSPFGSRLLKHWLTRPSACLDEILKRQSLINYLINNRHMIQLIEDHMSKLIDLERHSSMVFRGKSKVCDFLDLLSSIQIVIVVIF